MHLAVDRYLRGALSDEEAAEFEERLVWDQALIDEVDLAEKLRDGLRSELARNEASSAAASSTFSRVVSFFQAPAYAAAASFLIAVGLTSVGMLAIQTPGEVSPANGQMPTEIVALYATRSDAAVKLVVAEDAWTVLLVDAPYGYEQFRASVAARRGDDASVVWSRSDILPTYPESLALGMPGSTLEPGEYVLSLEGSADSERPYEPIQEIVFQVIRPTDESR